MKKKLKGEFISLELRNSKNEVIGINVFYNGVVQHTWYKNEIPQQP